MSHRGTGARSGASRQPTTDGQRAGLAVLSPAGKLARTLKLQGTILGGSLGLMWALAFLDLLLFWVRLTGFGIVPRTAHGLLGILFAPFLHAGIWHLVANSVSYLVLGWVVMWRDTRDFPKVFAISALVSGLGVWLFAWPGTVTVGASGVIFGFLGYLLSRGYFERSVLGLAISLGVLLTYGGMLWGMWPTLGGHISWLAHAFGFLGGVVAAQRLSRRPTSGRAPALPRSR